MGEFIPHLAPVVVLSFLVTLLMAGVSTLLLFYGALRRSTFFAMAGGIACAGILAGYGLLLCGVSLFSGEKIIAPGGWKYFCEIDCHLAYSVAGTQRAARLGAELQPVAARGQFIVVQVKTWFDERTISAHRGNGPLMPNPRRVVLVDDLGRAFAPSTEGERALSRPGTAGTPLSQPLRPGESYTTLVFDVPAEARGLLLLVTAAGWETRLLIGHENSPFHGKVFLGLAPALGSHTASFAAKS